ncbi:MAG: hypothetical protein QOF78_2680 [Phycisphaerales bacterium]|jgi:hypothetical protein|nr:hypothetical protein [Phycisphaerales bacterium]
MNERRRNILAAGLLVLGVMQMVGDVTGIAAIKGIAAATAASPAPRVFSAVRGLETFSTKFFLEWTDASGQARSMQLTPAIYSKMRGPYKRRNIYGAVLAYGPVLPARLRDPVLRYAVTGDAPLLREVGIDPSGVRDVRVRYEPLPGTPAEIPRVIEVTR